MMTMRVMMMMMRRMMMRMMYALCSLIVDHVKNDSSPCTVGNIDDVTDGLVAAGAAVVPSLAGHTRNDA
jgi:hypothetical protein